MRDSWLDKLRATAIAAVAGYHVVQMSPEPLAIVRWTRFGALGVDLFFVLSGFLIGTLYWQEQRAHGRIEVLRFWKRRWWRTLPAYYAALALSWLAVFATRREPFDFSYLLFLQNYREQLPFFMVSWSLCIEEHFYLFLPPLVLACSALKVPARVLFALLIPAPLALRYLASRDGLSPMFGFEHTATHLHMEGLLLGFALSALFVLQPQLVPRAQRLARIVVAPLVVLASWSASHGDPVTAYVLTATTVALAMSAALVAGVSVDVRGQAKPSALQALVYRLALISYSVYLTHALVIHVARTLSERLQLGVAGYLVLAPGLILVTGALFYVAVEKPSLRIRERFAPRRAA